MVDSTEVSPWQVVDDLRWAELQKRNEQPIDAIPTGYPTWDKSCRGAGGGIGLAKGWMVTLAGKQKQGKTTVALNILARAVRNGKRAGVISYEMSGNELMSRYLGIQTGVSLRKLEPGPEYDRNAWLSANERRQEVETGEFFLVERPRRGSFEYSLCLAEAREMGADVVFVDYAQKIGGDRDDLYTQMKQVSNLTQDAAQKGMTIIIMSQFNRSGTASKEAPSASNLMGGALESDADQIVFIDHTQTKREDVFTGKSQMILEMNRHGPSSTWPIAWDFRTLRCEEAAPILVQSKEKWTVNPKAEPYWSK